MPTTRRILLIVAALLALLFNSAIVTIADESSGVWTEKSFEDFCDGKFGNAGQNVYVSRDGILQRIFQFDFNKDAWLDLIFCTSQDHWEKPPAYIYSDPLGKQGRIELPSDGSMAATVADLNGDGLDDIVLGMRNNGIRKDLNAYVYFASPQGYSQRRHLRLPAPMCRSLTAGDFNGDGRADLAFQLATGLRVFYQIPLGFEPRRFSTLDLRAVEIAAEDLDGDGNCDLAARISPKETRIYWGGKNGLDLKRFAAVKVKIPPRRHKQKKKYAEYVLDADPLVSIVRLGDKPYVSMLLPDSVRLVPVDPNRKFGKPIELACSDAMSIAAGDINGDGRKDLVLACREQVEGMPKADPPVGLDQRSWIYWGGAEGYRNNNRTALPSHRACDVAVGDLDGDGLDDVVLCQCHRNESFTADCLVYRGRRDGRTGKPVTLAGEDSRRVFLAGKNRSQVLLVNHCARNKWGNIDVPIYFGGPEGFDPKRCKKISGWGALEALPCDLNDDGHVDILMVNASENSVDRDPGSYVFYGSADGFSYKPSMILPTTRAHGACCADFNNDGRLDLIFCGFDNPELLTFHGTDDGFDVKNPKRVRMEIDGVVYKDPRWIHLADLDNDGLLDLVVPMIVNDRSLLLWGGAEGFSMKRCQLLSVERAACARSADLSGNGYLDLILGGHTPTRGVPHDSFVYIFWNGPRGLDQSRRTMLPASGINCMSLADFNNDHTLDLFIGSYHAGTTRDTDSYIYWNRKGKFFSEADRRRIFCHSTSGSLAADFNKDGWTDLAVANHKVDGDHCGYSDVWWNAAGGFDELRTTRLPTCGPHGITAIEPGNQRDRGPKEYYQSNAHELPPGAVPQKVSWKADCPAHTWVKCQIRTAATRKLLAKAAWAGPKGKNSWYENGQAVAKPSTAGRWIQYRLALGAAASMSTPRVSEVNIEYGK